MVKKKLCQLSILLLLSGLYVVSAAENDNTSKITLQDCKLCGLECTPDILSSAVTYNINADGSKKLISIWDHDTGSKYIAYTLHLCEGGKSRFVLNTESTGGIDFLTRKDSVYPDIAAHASTSASTAVYYFYSWNGNKYIPASANVSAAMSKEAVQLIKKGEIEKATNILQIASQAEEATAEIMNNYGYARYLLAKQEDPIANYMEARNWLEKSLKSDPNRWSAYLNMGDLFNDNNDIMYAIAYYRKLLKIKPDYKFSKKITARINELILSPLKIGESIRGASTDFGMGTVMHTRLEDGRFRRTEYFEGDQQVYAVHHLRDGYADGEYIAYWSYGGGTRVKGQFSRGIRSGKFIYYDEKGNVVNEVNYDEKKANTKLEEDYRDF